MTETLHRHQHAMNETTDVAEGFRTSEEMINRLEALETPYIETRELSPVATRVRAAAERIADFLEARAVSTAHSEALKEYRDRDHSAYVDHVASLANSDESEGAQSFNKKLLRKEQHQSDREALLEGATLQLRAVGSLAVEQSLDLGKATGETMIGLGVIGFRAAAKKARGALLSYQINTDSKLAERDHAKQLSVFDRQAKKDKAQREKAFRKEEKVESKKDRQFDRNLKRGVRAEKRAERKEALVQKAERIAYRTGEAVGKSVATAERIYDSGIERKRKLGALAVRARSAGREAIKAGREELKK